MPPSSNYRLLMTETNLIDRFQPFEQIEICSDSNFYARNKYTVLKANQQIYSYIRNLICQQFSFSRKVAYFFIIFTKDQINKYNASPQVMPIPNTKLLLYNNSPIKIGSSPQMIAGQSPFRYFSLLQCKLKFGTPNHFGTTN